MGRNRSVDGTFVVCKAHSHGERVLTWALVSKEYRTLYTKIFKSTMNGAGHLEKFLSMQVFIWEIWHDVRLVTDAKTD